MNLLKTKEGNFVVISYEEHEAEFVSERELFDQELEQFKGEIHEYNGGGAQSGGTTGSGASGVGSSPAGGNGGKGNYL